MKKFMTIVCCLCMTVMGYTIMDNAATSTPAQNTLHAATIPSWNYNGPMPLDLQLDAAKRIKPDTVFIHDTVTVNNTKYVRVPVPKHTTDTIYVPLTDLPEVEITAVKNKSPDEQGQSIVLLIDGNEVYSSKPEINSGVSDEP